MTEYHLYQAKISKREAELEAMVFEQRQQLLAAIEHVRNREAELKCVFNGVTVLPDACECSRHADRCISHVRRGRRTSEAHDRSLQADEGRLRERERLLEARLRDVEAAKDALTAQAQQDVLRFKRDLERAHDEQARALHADRERLEEEKRLMHKEATMHAELMAQAKDARRDQMRSQAEMAAALARAEALIAEKEQLHERARALEAALERERELVALVEMAKEAAEKVRMISSDLDCCQRHSWDSKRCTLPVGGAPRRSRCCKTRSAGSAARSTARRER
jgi:hypothetical protein